MPLLVLATTLIGMATSLAPHRWPFLEEHVGHVAAAGVSDEPLDPADIAVGRVDTLAAAHVHLA
jgi:hypothetical protein